MKNISQYFVYVTNLMFVIRHFVFFFCICIAVAWIVGLFFVCDWILLGGLKGWGENWLDGGGWLHAKWRQMATCVPVIKSNGYQNAECPISRLCFVFVLLLCWLFHLWPRIREMSSFCLIVVYSLNDTEAFLSINIGQRIMAQKSNKWFWETSKKRIQ